MEIAMVVAAQLPFEQANPLLVAPRLRELQAQGAVHRVLTDVGDSAWLVTRHAEVRRLLDDDRLGRSHREPDTAARTGESALFGGPLGNFATEHTDHQRLRALLQPHFTPKHMRALRPRIEALATGLLDELAEHGPPADLHAVLALPLPILVICELLGVPYADRASFQVWTGGLMSTTALTPEQRAGHVHDLSTYMAGLVGQRRREPTDDLLGALVLARDEDDRLTERELISLAMTLLAGGHETTANQIANSVYLLLTHPDQLALLRSRPDSMPGAAEELMRFVPLAATAGTPRYATADVELTGGTVRAGDAVLVFVPAANRDPRVFPDPDRLDVTRVPGAHLALGHGAHHCLGAGLARMELQVALGSLLERFPGLRLAVDKDDLRWKAGTLVRGPVALPVAW